MKKVFFLLISALFISSVSGQAPPDTILKRVDTVLRRTDTINKKIESLTVKANTIKIAVDTLLSKAVADCKKCKDGKVRYFWDWVLVFLPAVLFLLLFIIIFSKGLKDFKLQEALAENDYTKITILNAEYNPANLTTLAGTNPPVDIAVILPPTIDVSNAVTPSFRPSISRYIAFITSILTLVVALCMSCFFIYHYIRTGCPPDLSALSTVLIALTHLIRYQQLSIKTNLNESKVVQVERRHKTSK